MSEAPLRRNCDVAVVGAGVIGLACAWRAAQRGLSVVVVERDEPGSGATGVAAGMLAPVTEADFGEEELLGENLAAARAWPAFAAELAEHSGRGTGYRECGALVVAADRDDAEELRRLHSHQRALGLDAEWLSGSECRAHEPALSPRVAGGILAPHDHQVDPPALVDCLVDAFGRAGGELLSGCGEAAIELDGRGAVVRTPRGDAIMTERVVIAAGAWSARVQGLEDVGGLPVRPVKGQIVSLRAPGSASLPSRTIRSPRCYLLNRGDGRIVLGATVEERGFDDSPTADGVYRLLEAAWEVLPGALELEWVAVRASLRPGSPDNAPVVGPADDERVVLATGHYRNGVLLAPVTADVVAELLAGDGRASTGEGGKLAWSSR